MSQIKVKAVIKGDGTPLLYPRGPGGQFVGWIGCAEGEAEYTIQGAPGQSRKPGPNGKGMIYDAENSNSDMFRRAPNIHLKRLPFEPVESTPEIRRALLCGDLEYVEPSVTTTPTARPR